jgi:hypothetical protein
MYGIPTARWQHLYFRVIRSHTETDEAIGDRERLIHIDAGIAELGEDAVGGVEAGGSGAYNGDTEGAINAARLLGGGGMASNSPEFCEAAPQWTEEERHVCGCEVDVRRSDVFSAAMPRFSSNLHIPSLCSHNHHYASPEPLQGLC